MEGQDIGAAPQEIFGESEYEYTMSVKAGQKGRVLLLQLMELFGGDSSVVSKFRQWLKANGIPFEFETF